MGFLRCIHFFIQRIFIHLLSWARSVQRVVILRMAQGEALTSPGHGGDSCRPVLLLSHSRLWKIFSLCIFLLPFLSRGYGVTLRLLTGLGLCELPLQRAVQSLISDCTVQEKRAVWAYTSQGERPTLLQAAEGMSKPVPQGTL